MGLNKEEKNKILEEFRLHEKDTGSAPVQIALLTSRINYLTEHFKLHPKDYHSKRGLLKLIGKRRRLLNYLSKKDKLLYEEILKRLNLRR
jgi:small subunit ribosomal protein S15